MKGTSLVRTRYIDFRTFYTAGYMVRTGYSAALYDYNMEQQFQNRLVSREDSALPMMCPPYTALLFVPFSMLTFQKAYIAFFFINLVLLLISTAIMAPYLNSLRSFWRASHFVLWLAFLPAGIALIMGQLSFVLLLLYCSSFHALKSSKPLIAGFLLSLALIKFQIALPVALLFLMWRQWRFLVGFAAGAAGVTIASVATGGASRLFPYMRSLFWMTRSVTSEHSSQSHVAILPAQMPDFYGLFFSICNESPVGICLAVAASLALFAWAITRPPSLPLAILVGILVSYHLFLYDLTLLLIPLSLTLNGLASEEAKESQLAKDRFAQTIRQRFRQALSPAAVAILLIAPFERFLIALDMIYLLAIPIIAITLFDRHQS